MIWLETISKMQIATKTTWCRHSSTGLEPEDIRMNIKITPGASQCPVPSGIHQTWVNDYCDGRFRARWTFASLGSWYQNRFQCGISIISHRFSAMSYVFLSALLPLALEKERLPWEKFWCCETMLRNPMKNWDMFSLQTKRNRRTKRMRMQTCSLGRVELKWNTPTDSTHEDAGWTVANQHWTHRGGDGRSWTTPFAWKNLQRTDTAKGHVVGTDGFKDIVDSSDVTQFW